MELVSMDLTFWDDSLLVGICVFVVAFLAILVHFLWDWLAIFKKYERIFMLICIFSSLGVGPGQIMVNFNSKLKDLDLIHTLNLVYHPSPTHQTFLRLLMTVNYNYMTFKAYATEWHLKLEISGGYLRRTLIGTLRDLLRGRLIFKG